MACYNQGDAGVVESQGKFGYLFFFKVQDSHEGIVKEAIPRLSALLNLIPNEILFWVIFYFWEGSWS